VNGVAIHDVNDAVWKQLLTAEYLREQLLETEDDRRHSREAGQTRELLYRKLLLEHLLEDCSRLRRDQRLLRMATGLVFDRYYQRIQKSVLHQIQAVDGALGIPILDRAYEEAIQGLPERTRLVGITVPTADQFYSALALAKRAKARFGAGVHVALGGSIFALMSQEQRTATLISGVVDSLCVHEGEMSFLGLCEHADGRNELDRVPNLLRIVNGQIREPRIEESVPLDQCPAPMFPDYLLESYGPDVFLPVWATRGCYWGKCTFCDYVHLSANNNNAETIRVARCVDVIEELIRRHGARNFEMITECLSPAFSRRFADELGARGLPISWTTHLKVEKKFGPELCRKMKASGCRRVTIGVESFNDRQLKIMKKGCTRADIVQMLTSLTEAGIDAIINIIVNFPSVTAEEARETLDCIKEYRRIYKDVNVFPFVLSRLTDIANSPQEFDIQLRPTSAKDHNRGFHFVEFDRTRGLSGEEERAMIVAYQSVGQSHQRRVEKERSLEILATHLLQQLVVKPQARFHALRGAQAREVVRLVGLETPAEEDGLVFDLESKVVSACPGPLLSLHAQMPPEGLPVPELAELVSESPHEAERMAFAAEVIRFGILLGLFTVTPAPGAQPLAPGQDHEAMPRATSRG
jgi:radical SAM superfamily enzyme YgiQ (UPF0313 family)